MLREAIDWLDEKYNLEYAFYSFIAFMILIFAMFIGYAIGNATKCTI
jgi:hypothetical protein